MTATLTPRERELARHALNFNKKIARLDGAYADKGTEEYEIWVGLCRKEMAESWHYEHSAEFVLTRAGAEAALEAGETLDEEDFK